MIISKPRVLTNPVFRSASLIRRRAVFRTTALFETFVPTTTPIRDDVSLCRHVAFTNKFAVEKERPLSYTRRKSCERVKRFVLGNMVESNLPSRADRDQLSALAASPHEHVSTARGTHTRPESMDPCAASTFRLVGSFWHNSSRSIPASLCTVNSLLKTLNRSFHSTFTYSPHVHGKTIVHAIIASWYSSAVTKR